MSLESKHSAVENKEQKNLPAANPHKENAIAFVAMLNRVDVNALPERWQLDEFYATALTLVDGFLNFRQFREDVQVWHSAAIEYTAGVADLLAIVATHISDTYP